GRPAGCQRRAAGSRYETEEDSDAAESWHGLSVLTPTPRLVDQAQPVGEPNHSRQDPRADEKADAKTENVGKQDGPCLRVTTSIYVERLGLPGSRRRETNPTWRYSPVRRVGAVL